MSAQYNIAEILDGITNSKLANYKGKYSQQAHEMETSYGRLKILNQLLYSVIPESLHAYVHIGAIDFKQMSIIIFTSNASTINNIKEFAQLILRRLDRENYTFNSIMFKVKVNLTSQVVANDEPRIIDDNTRQKLLNLANIIGKPELVNFTQLTTTDPLETEILI